MILSLTPSTVPTISFTVVVAGSKALISTFFSPKTELTVALFPTPVFPRTKMFKEKSKSSFPSASSCVAIFLAFSRLKLLINNQPVQHLCNYGIFRGLSESLDNPQELHCHFLYLLNHHIFFIQIILHYIHDRFR
ncbi:hypothetical protein POPTR_010G014401v4 [Populus trichocarpa]|uniref:Uncharacterized protein n=1 Tax=Populus trichocarpa TaxID=3694 RepID=A0ACC0SBZ7_POPTR|nr:hypothetical protein POPTR_010G014401v4 [Populus trichocarpa]